MKIRWHNKANACLVHFFELGGGHAFLKGKEVLDYATEWFWTYNNDIPNMKLDGITLPKN